MNTVMELGTAHPVVIFSKTSCCMSHTIIMLIRSFGANPIVYELDHRPDGVQMEKALMGLAGCNPSVPAVFIGNKYNGGSDEIMSLNIKGKLKPLLMKAYMDVAIGRRILDVLSYVLGIERGSCFLFERELFISLVFQCGFKCCGT